LLSQYCHQHAKVRSTLLLYLISRTLLIFPFLIAFFSSGFKASFIRSSSHSFPFRDLVAHSPSHRSSVPGWTHMSLMGRLVVPLGLNGRPHDPQVTTPSALRASLLGPPEDDIERIERANLAWLVFCQDTYSSTSSGWQGLIADQDLVSFSLGGGEAGRKRRGEMAERVC